VKVRVLVGASLSSVAVLAAAAAGAMTPAVAAATDSVVIATLLLVALVARLRPDEEVVSELAAAMALRPPAASAPLDFNRAQRLVGGALKGDELLHDRFILFLRSVVAQRLAVRHGIDLVRSPDAAAALLPRDLRQTLASDRPLTFSPQRLERLLSEVESL
jgi:hypothetical protein